MPKIYIDWTRHAESCANYYAGNTVDADDNKHRNRGYKELTGGKFDFSHFKATFKYEPNLSYIGMQHAINLGIIYAKKEKYELVFSSCMTRTIMTTLLAFRRVPNIKIMVVPFITETLNVSQYIDTDNQNTPVNSVELKKKIMFVKDWLEKSWLQNFDDIEVIIYFDNLMKMESDMRQIIKTEDFKHSKILDSIISDVAKYLQYRPSKYPVIVTNDVPTLIKNTSDKLKILVEYMKSLSINNDIILEIPKQIILEIEKQIIFYDEIIKPAILRGPEVDFSLLEKYEANKLNFSSNYDNFFKYVLGDDIIKTQLKEDCKIFCATHGNVLKKYLALHYKKIEEQNDMDITDLEKTLVYKESAIEVKEILKEGVTHVMNTAVFRETVEINKIIKHTGVDQVYDPPKIRTRYENFEILNGDICMTQSLKGFLNYDMTLKHEKILEEKIREIILTNTTKTDDIIMEIKKNVYKDDIIDVISKVLYKKNQPLSFNIFSNKYSDLDARRAAVRLYDDIYEYDVKMALLEKYGDTTQEYKKEHDNLLKLYVTDNKIRGLSHDRHATISKNLWYNITTDIQKDSKFYLTEPIGRYFSDNIPQQLKGGYYEKYMKYKRKYLKLKTHK